MNKTIWKFPLIITDRQTISLPADAEILSVQSQNDALCIWALVNPNSPKVPTQIEIFGTGHSVDCSAPTLRKFIGTVQTHGGSLVWHVFHRVN